MRGGARGAGPGVNKDVCVCVPAADVVATRADPRATTSPSPVRRGSTMRIDDGLEPSSDPRCGRGRTIGRVWNPMCFVLKMALCFKVRPCSCIYSEINAVHSVGKGVKRKICKHYSPLPSHLPHPPSLRLQCDPSPLPCAPRAAQTCCSGQHCNLRAISSSSLPHPEPGPEPDCRRQCPDASWVVSNSFPNRLR